MKYGPNSSAKAASVEGLCERSGTQMTRVHVPSLPSCVKLDNFVLYLVEHDAVLTILSNNAGAKHGRTCAASTAASMQGELPSRARQLKNYILNLFHAPRSCSKITAAAARMCRRPAGVGVSWSLYACAAAWPRCRTRHASCKVWKYMFALRECYPR